MTAMRAALLLLLLVGCQTASQPATVTLVASNTSATATAIAPPRAPLAVADDPHRSTDERCADAFATFRTRIHAGDTARAVRAALGAPTWLGSDSPVDVLGGEVPVEWTTADQVVVFMCLSEPDPRTKLPWSRWVIYARLEGRDHKTFGAFLASNGPKKLLEYALCHSETNGPMKIEQVR